MLPVVLGLQGSRLQASLLAATPSPTPTAIKLATSQSPATYGQPLSLTAGLVGLNPSAAPSGVVRFTADGIPLGSGAIDGSGRASLPVILLGAGQHVIGAFYDGDAANAATSTTLTQTIVQAPSSIALTSSASQATVGAAVVFTVVVKPAAAGAGVPTGVVTLTVGSHALASGALVGGTVGLTVSSLAVGANAVVAAYAGDANFLPASATLQVTIVAGGTQPARTTPAPARSNPPPSPAPSPVAPSPSVSPSPSEVPPSPTATVTATPAPASPSPAAAKGTGGGFPIGTALVALVLVGAALGSVPVYRRLRPPTTIRIVHREALPPEAGGSPESGPGAGTDE